MQQSPGKDFNQKGYFNSHTILKNFIFSCLLFRFFSFFFLYILLYKFTVLWAIMPYSLDIIHTLLSLLYYLVYMELKIYI